MAGRGSRFEGTVEGVPKPLIEVQSDKFVCPDVGFLIEKMHSGVYWAIFDGLTQAERPRLFKAWGIGHQKVNNGVLFLNSAIRVADVPDGMSNTIFVGEKTMPIIGGPGTAGLGWVSGTSSTLRNGFHIVDVNQYLNLRGSAVAPAPGSVKPQDPLLTVGGYDSLHSGGFQAGLGDASVRFINSRISGVIFGRLLNRDDDLPVDDF